MPAALTEGLLPPPTLSSYRYFIGLGPLWFVAMLLIFTFGYAIWRGLTGKGPSPSMTGPSRPGYLGIGVFTLALALVSYLTRFVVPLGKSVSLFVPFLSFPTIAYLPQYLSFFVLGVLLASLFKFGLASLIAVPACHLVAYLIRTIPGVSRIL